MDSRTHLLRVSARKRTDRQTDRHTHTHTHTRTRTQTCARAGVRMRAGYDVVKSVLDFLTFSTIMHYLIHKSKQARKKGCSLVLFVPAINIQEVTRRESTVKQ